MEAENVTPSSARNQTACDVFVYQGVAVVLFPIFYAAVFLISLCGNSLVLYVMCQRKQKSNSTSIYLLNLALSDALFTLALPARITYYIRHFDWPFGDLLCRLTMLLFFANTYAGIGFMTCISLDRYLAMVHPHQLQCLRSVKVVRRVCCLVWALVCLQVAPLMFRSTLYEHQQRRTCMEYFNFEGSRFTPYLLLLACAVSFCCPLITIAVCYAKINLKLHTAAKQNSITGRLRRNHRANTIILLVLFTFLVCFSPYHLNVMQFMSRKIQHQPVCEELRAFKVSLQITVSLMNLNCCLDPLLYFFAIKTYKRKVLNTPQSRPSDEAVTKVLNFQTYQFLQERHHGSVGRGPAISRRVHPRQPAPAQGFFLLKGSVSCHSCLFRGQAPGFCNELVCSRSCLHQVALK